jgi:hypothetical protein
VCASTNPGQGDSAFVLTTSLNLQTGLRPRQKEDSTPQHSIPALIEAKVSRSSIVLRSVPRRAENPCVARRNGQRHTAKEHKKICRTISVAEDVTGPVSDTNLAAESPGVNRPRKLYVGRLNLYVRYVEVTYHLYHDLSRAGFGTIF